MAPRSKNTHAGKDAVSTLDVPVADDAAVQDIQEQRETLTASVEGAGQSERLLAGDAFSSDRMETAVPDARGSVIVDPERSRAEEDAKVAFERAVLITSNGHDCVVHPGEIIVVCRDPGFRRAGIEHPAMRVYRRYELSKKQLGLMRAEPLLEIIEVG